MYGCGVKRVGGLFGPAARGVQGTDRRVGRVRELPGERSGPAGRIQCERGEESVERQLERN